MVKRLGKVMVLLLAINFMAALGGVGWLMRSGHLDRSRIAQIRQLLFPPPEIPATQPSLADATTQPTLNLEQLLATGAGRTAAEQTDLIQHTFDERMLELDRRTQELRDLQAQVDMANQKLAADRLAFAKAQKALQDQQQEADRLQNDKGFQDSLALLQSMPTKQAKTIFMTFSPKVATQYLQAMDSRAQAKIVAEFKTPDELAFIESILNGMRQVSRPMPPQP